MADKAVGTVVNLIQRIAIAASGGKADAKVDYIPVSRDPYVNAWIDGGFDAAEDLRTRLVMSLIERGFRRAGDHTLVHQTDRGFIHVDIEGPDLDESRRQARLQLRPSGPYDHASALREGSRRDVAAERASYVAHERQMERERFWRWQGTSGVIGDLIRRAPFEIPYDDARRILNSQDRVVAIRVAEAFASQTLSSFDDLVERAQLGDLLGRTPAPEDGDEAPAPRM